MPPKTMICGPGLPPPTPKEMEEAHEQKRQSSRARKPLQETDPNANATPAKNSDEASSNKKKTAASKREDATSPKASKNKDASKKDDTTPTTASSLSTIHLDGEEDETVPIFATCDDIRKSITEYLAKTSTAKAAFARELTELLPKSKVTPKNIDQFLKMKGPAAGGHNIVFYAGYVFFEKIRVRDGKKKYAKRQKLEEIYGKNKEGVVGFARVGSHEMTTWAPEGTDFTISSLGEIEEVKNRILTGKKTGDVRRWAFKQKRRMK